jgi:hypothetical protein
VGAQLGVDQLGESCRVAGEQVADRLRGEHRARPDPAHLETAAGEQLAQLLGAVAAGDGAVRPGDEHHVGVGHVDQVRPAVLLGQRRHPEHERVHAGEHLTAGAEHARDLGDHVLGGQPQRERAILGDHAVGAAVGEELEPGPVGRHGGEAATGGKWGLLAVCASGPPGGMGGRGEWGAGAPHAGSLPPISGGHRGVVPRGRYSVDHAQHIVAGVGGQLGGARARAG